MNVDYTITHPFVLFLEVLLCVFPTYILEYILWESSSLYAKLVRMLVRFWVWLYAGEGLRRITLAAIGFARVNIY